MADNNIKVSIEIAAAAAQKALDDLGVKSDTVDKGFQKIKESGGGTFDEIGIHIGKASGIYDIFAGNLLANVAIKALELLADAAGKVFEQFSEGVKFAEDYQQATVNLNSALASSGNYSADASKELREYADGIQATTKYSNTAVLSNAALLESLTHLDKDGLQTASKASIELASRLGIDLRTATELVGKAFEGNVTALKRQGIEVQEGATKAQTFSNFLGEMAASSKRAEDEVQTFGGAVTQAGHAFEEVQRPLGEVIVQNPVLVAGIKAISQSFLEFGAYVENNKQDLKELVADGFILLINTTGYLVSALDVVVRAGEALYNGLKVVINGIGAGFAGLLSLVSDGAKVAFQHFKDEAETSMKAVNDSFTKQTGLQTFAETIAGIGLKAEGAFGQLKAGADGTKEPINGATRSVKELATAVTDAEKAAKALSDSFTKESGEAKKSYEQQTKDLKSELDKQKALNAQALAEHKITLVQRDQADKKAEDQFNQDASKNLSDKYATEQAQLDLALQKNLITKQTYAANEKQLQIDEAADFKRLNDEATATSARNAAQQTKDKQIQLEEQQKDVRETLGGFATLMQTSSRELFAIGKAAALANATINTYEAITKTMAFTPYPFNIPLAIAQGVAGAVQVANIASQNPSFESGGIVPGTSFTGDKVAANVNSGEMILNRQQQSQLFSLANGSGGGGGQIQQLIALVGTAMTQPLNVNIDGKQIISVTRDQLRQGRAFA